GIDLTYTDKVEALDPKLLSRYDGLLLYANTTRISPEQEKALLDFVEGGKGFVPVHCASYCFLNSPRYVALVGAQFLRHGTGTFPDRPERTPKRTDVKPFEYVEAKCPSTPQGGSGAGPASRSARCRSRSTRRSRPST